MLFAAGFADSEERQQEQFFRHAAKQGRIGEADARPIVFVREVVPPTLRGIVEVRNSAFDVRPYPGFAQMIASTAKALRHDSVIEFEESRHEQRHV